MEHAPFIYLHKKLIEYLNEKDTDLVDTAHNILNLLSTLTIKLLKQEDVLSDKADYKKLIKLRNKFNNKEQLNVRESA